MKNILSELKDPTKPINFNTYSSTLDFELVTYQIFFRDLQYYLFCLIFGLYVWKTKPVFIFIQYQRGRRARGRVWVFVVTSTEYCPCRGYYHLVPQREWPTLTQILPNLSRQNTRLRKVIPLNKCVGIALWDWELETCTEPLE